jgi:uncharacterized protein (DUF1697 family)
MNTYIALFRGINVGGHNLLQMKELTALLEHLGLQNVRTYIQSGNVIFCSGEDNASALASKISAEIKKSRGFELQVLLMEKADMKKAMEANPFPEAESEPNTLHLLFLFSVPERPDLQALESIQKESERFVLKSKVFYLHAPEGVGKSKLAANIERLLGVPTTGRNWRTVCRIMEMAKE